MPITSQAALEILLQARDDASEVVSGLGDTFGGLGTMAAGVASGGLALVGGAIAGVAAGALAAGEALWSFSEDADAAMGLFAAQTGTATEDLDEFRAVAMEVWSSGWGDSVEDVTEQMSAVHRSLGLTGEELEDATEKAIILGDVFGTDVAESTAIASSMMTNFGLDADDAFDLITAGSQMGLDRMGDLGDTLREYSSDFDRLGFTAEETLSVLNAGLEAGAYNTDVVADGIREFGIRFGAAEESAVAALDAIGLDSADLYQQFQDGSLTTSDAMAIVSEALAGVDDVTLQAQAGAALFGSKWEDIGGDVFIAAGMAQEGIEGLEGATDAAGAQLQTGLGPALERLKRTAIESLSPLGDDLGDMIDEAIPYLEQAATWLGENIPDGIEWLREKAEDLQPSINWIRDQFKAFSSSVLPWLRDAWDVAGKGMEDVSIMWNEQLQPALDDLADTLGLNTDEAGGFMSMMGDVAGATFWVMIQQAVDLVKFGVQGFTLALDGLNWGLQTVNSTLQWFQDAWDRLDGVNLPDWLTPGSPTPFEIGLRGITDAIEGMPDLSMRIGSSVAGGGLMDGSMLAAGGGGGGGVTEIHNHFGRDSVRSDQDIEEISRKQEEMLLLRGVRSFAV